MHGSQRSHTVVGRYWHRLPDGRIQCDLCPRYCRLHAGQRGFCFVRERQNDHMVLTSYGRSTGFCIDPIEKKPLYQFLPGSKVLSFGTAGCNLGCLFCQNWNISKSREMERLSTVAFPETIAQAARKLGCSSVAFTYNDPVIFLEYAVDTAKACHELGIKSVAVTAGYIGEEARKEFFKHMDAANVDLKGFTEEFYHRICAGHLQPVLDTLIYLHNETNVWMEVTCLLIAGENDSEEEINRMTEWMVEHLGPNVPIHFTAFHPDWKMLDPPATPASTLHVARNIALRNGIRYVYVGNVFAPAANSTYCHQCGVMLIGRDWFDITNWNLTVDGHCRSCGARCSGVFEGCPSSTNGRFMPIRIEEFVTKSGEESNSLRRTANNGSDCARAIEEVACFHTSVTNKEMQEMAETLPIRKIDSVFDEIEKMNDQVMQRAYEIFSDGGIFGRDIENWLQAERELMWKPAIELEEKDGEFRLEVAVPGVDPKNIDIEVTPEDILVKADVHHEHKDKKGEVYACEFATGNLFRSIHLPKKIDADKVKAQFNNGMLTLKAPVAKEARARKVTIEAA